MFFIHPRRPREFLTNVGKEISVKSWVKSHKIGINLTLVEFHSI